MLKKLGQISIIILLFLPMAFSFNNASTTSYTIGSTHTGISGDDVSTNSYDARSTTTYEQGSNIDGTTTSYDFNLGWFFYPVFVQQTLIDTMCKGNCFDFSLAIMCASIAGAFVVFIIASLRQVKLGKVELFWQQK